MYSVPRTASLGGLQLASQKQSPNEDVVAWPEQRQVPLQHTPGASPWAPEMSSKSVQEERLTQARGNDRILAGSPVTPGAANKRVGSAATLANGKTGSPSRSVAQWESTKPGSEPATERYANNGSIKLQPNPIANEPTAALARSDSKQLGPGRLAAAQGDSGRDSGGDSGELRLSDSVPTEPTRIEGLSSPAVEELPAPEPMPGSNAAPLADSANPPATIPSAPPAPKMLVETERPTAPSLPAVPQDPVATETESGDIENDPHAVPMGPTEQNTYHSRSKSFSLDYDIDMTRGSRVSSIELWGTMDNGKTWSKWGEDEDRESPFDIRVDEEGMFGFRVVIVGSNLIASNQPRAGDPADAWIYVDTKAPDVKIISAVYGAGEEAGHLVIDYSCADDELIDRPISISFSERRDGPWTTVASGLKNTGRYLWPAEPNLPKRIYLRIEAVDRAANIGVYRLDLPVDVEGLTPRGRIKGFRPITD
jgi:hypothetical protein